MDYTQVVINAREHLGPYCKGCMVCNGIACKNTIPGPGAKGVGDTAIRNYQKWQELRVHMDTITENFVPDTRLTLFGKTWDMPVFAGPVGAVKLHYGDQLDDNEYNNIILKSTAENGIAAFTGDGVNPEIMQVATAAIKNQGGIGIPTIKPWDLPTVKEKLALAKQSGCFAVAMDIDAAGLPFLKNRTPPAGSKTTAELQEIIELAQVPFIVKGVMTVSGALKAKQAGAHCIVVSNHGGRVLDGCPATAEVLKSIVGAVGSDMKILVDGGIRSGLDIFRALALGADGVIIARPFVTAVYGAQQEGVTAYMQKLKSELADVMSMCGAKNLQEINSTMLYYKEQN